jgi:hemolysin activation/secretion protein
MVVALCLTSVVVGFAQQPPQPKPFYFIREYRVSGSTLVAGEDISKVVYPFLGPGRTAEDIEQARVALEKLFHGRGYQAVTVNIPQQSGRRGIIRMEVVEARVGHLNVNGARWHLPSAIRRKATSMAPGQRPSFHEIERDVIALNQSADMRVKPRLTPTADPAVLDFDLDVEDKLPLHGSFEINNRYSPFTVPYRLNGSISYENLWQLGHSLSVSVQIAPERLKDGEVYTGSYAIPLSDDVNFVVSGMRQKSNINTLGNSSVIGQGTMLGLSVSRDLEIRNGLIHSVSFGIDYKDFNQTTLPGGNDVGVSAPVQYWPLNLTYNAALVGKSSFTSGSLSLHWAFRRAGSNRQDFENRRFNADSGFLYLRGDVSHLQDLSHGWQLFVRGAGQLTGNPLINNEQFVAGGQASVRGYLESVALGDNGVTGTIELKSPSFLGPRTGKQENGTASPSEWRVHAFADGGLLSINDGLPEQAEESTLASVGVGTELRLQEHWHALLNLGFPLLDVDPIRRGELLLSFRLWAEF